MTQNEKLPMLPARTEKIITNLYAIGPRSEATGKVKGKAKAKGTVATSGGYWSAYVEQKPLDKYKAVTPMSKNLLFSILSIQSDTGRTALMEGGICAILDRWMDDGMDLSYQWDAQTGNIYVTKGQAVVYPTIIAHTDTVHRIVPNKEYQVRSNGKQMWAWNPVKNKAQGIGGDDKVGIFIALSMLQLLPAAKAAFFVDEEIGCVGSSRADMSFFADSAFVLECDRKGNRDFVDRIFGTDLYGKDFSTAVKPLLQQFSYSETNGGLTDVLELKDNGLKVACANMSCGYFNPHTSSEFVSLPDVQRTFDLVYAICTELGDRQWVHEYVKPTRKATGKSTIWEWDKDSGNWTFPAKMTQTTTAADDDAQWAELREQADADWDDKYGPGYLESAEDDVSELRERFPNLYGEMTVADLLNADRDLLIEDKVKLDHDFREWASAMGYTVAEDVVLRYPVCPICVQDTRVIWDSTQNDYWCIDCDARVPTTEDLPIITAQDHVITDVQIN